jgi:hypothetical protein
MRKPSGDDWAKRPGTCWRWIETSGGSGRKGVERTGAGERMLPPYSVGVVLCEERKADPEPAKMRRVRDDIGGAAGGFGMTLGRCWRVRDEVEGAAAAFTEDTAFAFLEDAAKAFTAGF